MTGPTNMPPVPPLRLGPGNIARVAPQLLTPPTGPSNFAAYAANSTTSTTVTLTLNNVPAGATIIVYGSTGANPVTTTLSDSASANFAQFFAFVAAANSLGGWIAQNVAAGTHTLTITASSSVVLRYVAVAYNAGGLLNFNFGAASNGAVVTPPAITPTIAGATVVALTEVLGSPGPPPALAGTPASVPNWPWITQNVSQAYFAVHDFIMAAAGPATLTIGSAGAASAARVLLLSLGPAGYSKPTPNPLPAGFGPMAGLAGLPGSQMFGILARSGTPPNSIVPARQIVAIAPQDQTQPPAVITPPVPLPLVLTQAPIVQIVAAPLQDQTQPGAQLLPGLGFAHSQYPPVPTIVAAQQQDPTQVPAAVLTPPYATPIVLGQPPLAPISARPQDDPTQFQPQVLAPLRAAQAGTQPPVVPLAARPQDDPTQIAASLKAGLGATLAPPPIRPLAARPQDDPSQVPALVLPGLGATLPRPPITPFVAAPQSDLTQVAPSVFLTPLGTQAQPSTTPATPQVWAPLQDPTQIGAILFAPPYATPVAPQPTALSPLDPRVIARRHNFRVQWGFKPERPYQTPAPAARTEKVRPAVEIREAHGISFEPPVRLPAEVPAKPAVIVAHKAPKLQPKTAKGPGKPWPKPPFDLAAAQAVAPAEVERDTLAAQIATMQDQIARLAAKLDATQTSLEAALEAERAARARQEHRARAAEEETTRQVAQRAAEARQAEVDLRRARNNLVAVQTAVRMLLSDDPE